jgi:alkylation response protein AidB-like acyl-CoA dehydrogenase
MHPLRNVLDPQENTSTAASIQSAVRELTPLIWKHRDETESRRIPATPIVAALRSLRLCRLELDSELHGHGMPVHEALAIFEDLAYAEASVGWIVWNNALPCVMARFLDASARTQVFGGADWIYATSTRPSGQAAVAADGYRLNGRWTIVSGCELAEWIMLLGAVEEGGRPRMIAPDEPEQRFCFVRRGSFKIIDTWHSGGLRGTGSHDVVVKDALVPRAQSFSPGDPSRLDTPLGRVPIICTMAAAYGALALGIARRTVDALMEIARSKVSPDSGAALHGHAPTLAAIARHTAALNAARAWLRGCARNLWQTALAAGPADAAEITATWSAALHAAEVAQDAVSSMYAAGGIDSLYTSTPLERAHRDMHALRRHIVGQNLWLEDAGRVMLAQSAKHPLYAL